MHWQIKLPSFVESEEESIFSDTVARRVNSKSIFMGNIGSYVKNLINIYIFGTIIQLVEYHLEKN